MTRNGVEASTWDNGECTPLQKESLKCLMDHNGRRDLCQAFFERYKQCIKERRERLLEERNRRK